VALESADAGATALNALWHCLQHTQLQPASTAQYSSGLQTHSMRSKSGVTDIRSAFTVFHAAAGMCWPTLRPSKAWLLATRCCSWPLAVASSATASCGPLTGTSSSNTRLGRCAPTIAAGLLHTAYVYGIYSRHMHSATASPRCGRPTAALRPNTLPGRCALNTNCSRVPDMHASQYKLQHRA
jgi:hypothetical protein